MQSSNSLPLNQQCRLLLQDIKKIKKEAAPKEQRPCRASLNERELKRILFPNENSLSISSVAKENAHQTVNYTKAAITNHRKQVLQEISNIKRIKDPITNYQQFFRENYLLKQAFAEPETPVEKYSSIDRQPLKEVEYNLLANDEDNFSKMGLRKDKSVTSLRQYSTVEPTQSYNKKFVDSSLSSYDTKTDKENRYTMELRKLVQERKALKSINRL